ncbi:hypothetical protein ACIBK8_29725 [Streptomyces sp. NPDC050161]|uniref:SCO6745 family protein n=1 Tax=Streptomyces sp. NPDC050161 TaxID=3365604 RepID=UPI00378F1D73
MTPLPERAGRRCHNALGPLDSAVYFAPEFVAAFAKFGVDDWHAAYFTARSAAMGPVNATTVDAVFYPYRLDLIAQHIPKTWQMLSPQQALEARTHVADAMLRRLLGEDALASKDLAKAAELATRAIEACEPGGRPLSAGLAALPVPEAPHLALWHAAGVLREYRGDGHIIALAHAGLDGLEAQVTHTATGKGIAPAWVARTRGWTPDDWSAAQDRLRDRGLLTVQGELTDQGRALRRDLEDTTDRLDRAPYEHLGATHVGLLTELATTLTTTIVNAGAFPADLFGKG